MELLRRALLVVVACLGLAACGSATSADATPPRPPLLPTTPTPTADLALPGTTVSARDPSLGSSLIVRFDGTAFAPKDLEVDPGDAVVFRNEGPVAIWPASNIHPTHDVYPGFDVGLPLEPGESWTFTLDQVGAWRYHNHLEPTQGGLIRVRGEVDAEPALALPDADIVFEVIGQAERDNARSLFVDDDLLEEFIRRFGPAATVGLLSANKAALGGDCHPRAHELGRISYGLFGARAFSLSGHECQSGGFHGATEALFRDHGAATLAADVATICGGEIDAFFEHQCVHGVGHGLMAWTSYDLPDALSLCDQVTPETSRSSCFSGVFMENVVGGLSGSMGHYTKFLSSDPHYPCNILRGAHVAACYFYQTSRMVHLFGGDFSQVADACAGAPEPAQRFCYQSMGRDVGAATRGDPERAIASCGFVQAGATRTDCLVGAVQDWFWEASGADEALGFCALVDEGQKGACYDTLTVRAVSIYPEHQGLLAFCVKVDPRFRGACPTS